MPQTQLFYRSIDDYLGPSDTRFFSRGYRRAEHQVSDLRASATDSSQPQMEATVTVDYPRDWSQKTDQVDLQPHLSSIDMIVLGAQLSEAHLIHSHGKPASAGQNMWLRRVTLKAGTTPRRS
ncbi:hypothetical protein GCM10022402_48340 [Salinactinospora qingdaonensis]|uniref:Uncharacterized protein n=1 Tax=Salinactinospora qingdaonensis TaxID=702744 RepID=A0ABP7GL52_9ACTN